MFQWASPLEKWFKVGLILSGTALLVILSRENVGPYTGTLIVFSVIAFYLHFIQVDISVQDAYKTYFFWDVALYASIFLYHPASVSAWIIFSSGLLYELWRVFQAAVLQRRRINPDIVLYNFANPFMNVLYVPIVGATYRALAGGQPLLGGPQNLVAVAASILVFLAAATVLDLLNVAVRRELSMRQIAEVWRSTYSSILLHLAMLAPLGVVLALLYRAHSPALILLAIPVTVVQAAVKARRDVLRDIEVVIEAMVGVLEERDQYTFGHSERVSLFAEAIAQEMGLSSAEVSQIRKAGRIHDIGKIDVPDAVLRKPAGLNPDELVKMKSHTDRNYTYLGQYTRLGRHIPFELAAYHHERYDGMGYIMGLKGTAIPLGSRIISVADTYDAITSDRPYRQGLPADEAMRRLHDAAGTQLDPIVVDAIIRLHGKGRLEEINLEFRNRERTPK